MNDAFLPISRVVARRLLEVASERLGDEPVIALQDPTVGKLTLLGELASTRGVEVVDLDEPATRAAVLADPGAFVDARYRCASTSTSTSRPCWTPSRRS